MNYGRYQIIDELGRGSMGVVYKAHDPQIDRTIALKVLREDRVTSEDFVKRFLKEAMAVGRLSHPGIVTVYDVGQDHGSIYIAMEFLHGTPLDELMADRKFTLEEIVDIGIQTAQALHYAHQHGIVHRDIKPPNIIYSPEGQIQVTDFGIARIEDPNGQQLTQVGEILGTPRYMSPEQAMGQPLDGRSDLYSLGVILYQLTTGEHPFKGDTLVAIFRAITQDTPEKPHVLDPAISEALSDLIMVLLDKDPAKRFAGGDELIDQLRSCLASPPMHPVEMHKSSTRRVGIAQMAILACLIIGVGWGGYFFYQLRKEPFQSPPERSSAQPEPPPANQNQAAEKTLLPVDNNPPSPNSSGDDSYTQKPMADPVEVGSQELILQGTGLSITVTDLPKKEMVLNSALELAKISPRYQEDVQIAENTYNNVRTTQQKKLDLYVKEISNLSKTYTAKQLTEAMAKAGRENVSARHKIVIELSAMHLKSLQNGATLDPDKVLNDFSQHFSDFAD